MTSYNYFFAKFQSLGVSREKIRSGTLALGNCGRFLAWEVSAGLVFLREYSLQCDLSDSALIISFGGILQFLYTPLHP
jgi:hypothetical protein